MYTLHLLHVARRSSCRSLSIIRLRIILHFYQTSNETDLTPTASLTGDVTVVAQTRVCLVVAESSPDFVLLDT